MDTKLKNRHKLAVVIIIFVILIPAIVMVNQYGPAYWQAESNLEVSKENFQTEQNFVERFVEACYMLYNTETSKKEEDNFSEVIKNELEEVEDMDYCREFLYFLDYQVTDEKGNVISKTMADSSDRNYPNEENMSSYAIGMVITFDENGAPTAVIKEGEYKEEQSVTLRKVLGNFGETRMGEILQNMNELEELRTPKNRTYYLAMQSENMEEYFEEYDDISAHQTIPEWVGNIILILLAIVAGAAIVLPFCRSFQTGDEKIFQMPFEVALIGLGYSIIAAFTIGSDRILSTRGYAFVPDFIIWVSIFAVLYWSVSCLRHIFTIGPKKYFGQCTIILPAGKYIKRVWQLLVQKTKVCMDKLYHSFDNIDLSEKNNKTIVKLVLINFAILFVITCMWFVGIFALMIYSVLLFFILRKYFNDLKDKYAVLLDATNQMAEGKLDVEIDEDLGVFNPFKTEFKKIQDGYQKAVEKEVKSQRMKTELITNVSHDLKTPLTAIITYINLLKDETDEEKRKDYIDVLDRKSLRLKALIEDLFEISKASSKNVTLHFTNVDVVNLFKQVHLELKEKFEEAELEFRCTYPEEKLIAELDSQKTYRIFENLLVNVAKYAMPKTRVYVTIEKKDDKAVLRMMNISAAEINFKADEITERFMRGDASRNTEGSGLGLAIAKSFTELQKGSFKIETEGDLFKAEVAFQLGTGYF